ncbi:MAG: hypothetical protein AB7L84_09600 [Acidimicrobiia bacterium]
MQGGTDPVPGLGERIEASPVGRAAAAGLVLAMLVLHALIHVPADAAVARAFARPAATLAGLTGAEMSWGVFAPDPRDVSRTVSARVEYVDGTVRTWRPPMGDAVLGHYRFYRWRKWVEVFTLDAWSELWEPAARWIADEMTDPAGPAVARVVLLRHHRTNDPVAVPGPYETTEMYVLDLAGASG